MKKRTILILSASIGAGHIKAAEAIRDELAAQFPEDRIKMLDFMDRRISLFHWMLKKLYLFMLDFVPNLYDVFYRVSGGSSGGTFARQMAAVAMYLPMARLLEHHKPDLIVCTHPFPEGAAALWKRFHDEKLCLAAVLTDYSLHQIWIYRHVDIFFTATEEMRKGLLNMGFPEASVHACGIPIASTAAGGVSKAEIRRSMDIPAENRVLLLMGGGLGLGGIEATLDELEKLGQKLTILVVAGQNRKLMSRIQARKDASRHELRVWGYTQEIPKLMRVSDMLITKPGALTISEAFSVGLPMLLHEPIPGPETENAIYAESRGAAVWVHRGDSPARILKQILETPGRLESMSQCAAECGRPEAVKDIVHHLGYDN